MAMNLATHKCGSVIHPHDGMIKNNSLKMKTNIMFATVAITITPPLVSSIKCAAAQPLLWSSHIRDTRNS